MSRLSQSAILCSVLLLPSVAMSGQSTIMMDDDAGFVSEEIVDGAFTGSIDCQSDGYDANGRACDASVYSESSDLGMFEENGHTSVETSMLRVGTVSGIVDDVEMVDMQATHSSPMRVGIVSGIIDEVIEDNIEMDSTMMESTAMMPMEEESEMAELIEMPMNEEYAVVPPIIVEGMEGVSGVEGESEEEFIDTSEVLEFTAPVVLVR